MINWQGCPFIGGDLTDIGPYMFKYKNMQISENKKKNS